jgi:transglutaminase-like putative cysteine protease
MKIRTGFEISYESVQPTPMLLVLSVHPSRFDDLLTPQLISFDPPTPSRDYRDRFGNVCTRLVVSPGQLTISADFIVADPGEPDPVRPDAI